MGVLIWIGAMVSLLGVAGLFLCVYKGLTIRRSGADEASQQRALRQLFVINFASLGLSTIGLALVITGISLG